MIFVPAASSLVEPEPYAAAGRYVGRRDDAVGAARAPRASLCIHSFIFLCIIHASVLSARDAVASRVSSFALANERCQRCHRCRRHTPTRETTRARPRALRSPVHPHRAFFPRHRPSESRMRATARPVTARLIVGLGDPVTDVLCRVTRANALDILRDVDDGSDDDVEIGGCAGVTTAGDLDAIVSRVAAGTRATTPGGDGFGVFGARGRGVRGVFVEGSGELRAVVGARDRARVADIVRGVAGGLRVRGGDVVGDDASARLEPICALASRAVAAVCETGIDEEDGSLLVALALKSAIERNGDDREIRVVVGYAAVTTYDAETGERRREARARAWVDVEGKIVDACAPGRRCAKPRDARAWITTTRAPW